MTFSNQTWTVTALVENIKNGIIGLPEIQRPFVWEKSRVRDFFDSMYRDFPVGSLLFWQNISSTNVRPNIEGVTNKMAPQFLIVDGQQRLISLYAVLKYEMVLTKNYKKEYIRIAFNPIDGQFEVSNVAIERDPRYIACISDLWSPEKGFLKVTKEYLARLKSSNVELSQADEDKIQLAINKLWNLKEYIFTVMVLSANVEEEKVAEIFVRINSKAVNLTQADFILTLLSVFGEDYRKKLEIFSQKCLSKSRDDKGEYNDLIQPLPDELLRICVGYGFRRAQLKYVYLLLRGKDLSSGDISDERRESQFKVLSNSIEKSLDTTSWMELQNIVYTAGYLNKGMITSKMGVLYTYIFYLIGKHDYNVPAYDLRKLMARWFFMTAITGRYTTSPESVMESDLNKLRNVKTADEFVNLFEQIIKETLTEDYWNITLSNDLQRLYYRTPVMFAYYAALNNLDANVLFSNIKVSKLLDKKGKKSALEQHHLFPKNYLKKKGITEIIDINQAANISLIEWRDDIEISDKPPYDYVTSYYERYNNDLPKMKELHGLPEGWERMEYFTFLAERRKLMAKTIRKGFEKLYG